MALEIVIDASVSVSAVFGGDSLQALRLAFSVGKVFISARTREELLSLPDKLASKLTTEQRQRLTALLTSLVRRMEEVRPSRQIDSCRDPKDNAYLSACHAAKAKVLLSRDRALTSIPSEELKAAGLYSLEILEPEEFIEKNR